MNPYIRIGIIGDCDPKKYVFHVSTHEALGHAASASCFGVCLSEVKKFIDIRDVFCDNPTGVEVNLLF